MRRCRSWRRSSGSPRSIARPLRRAAGGHGAGRDRGVPTVTAGEAAYQQLVEPYRIELHAHCYRMLGSVQDAEDALQDALTNAWRALPRFEGRSSLRSWLYRITTNACLKLIERRPQRMLPIDYGPAAERGRRARRAARRVGVGRAVPRRPARVRAARERRVGVHRGAAAPRAAPARGADPPRRARLLRRRGGGDAGHDAGRGLQRAAARAPHDRRSGCRSRASRRRSASLGDERAPRARRPLHARVAGRRRRRGRRPADRGRHAHDAAAALLVQRPRRGRPVPARVPVQRQRRAGGWNRRASTGRWRSRTSSATRRTGSTVLTLRGERIADITTFLDTR